MQTSNFVGDTRYNNYIIFISEESLKEAMDFFNPNNERKCYDDQTKETNLSSNSLKKDGRRHSYEDDLHKRDESSRNAVKAWCMLHYNIVNDYVAMVTMLIL